jgi:hypothetical protein
MPGGMLGIHVFPPLGPKDVDGRHVGERSEPFFERPCPAMTFLKDVVPSPRVLPQPCFLSAN